MNRAALWCNPFRAKLPGADTEVSFLSTVSVFDTLSRGQKRKLISLMHTRQFSDGEIVFRKEDPGVGMYVIRAGSVDIFNELPGLEKKRLISLGTGDFFGEMALLSEAPRSATAVSSGPSTLLGLFRHDLLEIMDSDPALGAKLAYRLAQIMSERLRLSNEAPGE